MNHSPACALCHRLFTPDSDDVPICGDCNFLLVDDHGSPLQDDYRAMLHRLRGGTRRRRSTGYEDYDSLGASRRWRRGLSDTESDAFDSFLGESGSNFSFGSSRFYHDEDDSISVDEGEGGSFLGNDDFSQPGNETGSDIDPMHAGLHHWNSQDIEEDDVEEHIVWEETQHGPPNYLQATQFDALLEHLAEADSSRRGAPPAALSFVRALPRLVVSEDPDELACAICKDPLHTGTVVNQLPCSHLYHPSCILPWLSSRNSCPLCRYELPTDDRDYEDRKQTGEAVRETQQQIDSSSDGEELEGVDVNGGAERENRRTRGWMFLAAAAAPVVGAILMLCFGSQAERRWRTTGRRCLPPRDSGQNRGWWGFLF